MTDCMGESGEQRGGGLKSGLEGVFVSVRVSVCERDCHDRLRR